jgi:hypothetical protein
LFFLHSTLPCACGPGFAASSRKNIAHLRNGRIITYRVFDGFRAPKPCYTLMLRGVGGTGIECPALIEFM